MIFGEKGPDPDDPRYRARREREMEAGRRFAEWSGLNRLAVWVQLFANAHRVAFVCIAFGLPVFFLALDVASLVRVTSRSTASGGRTAVAVQDSVMRSKGIISGRAVR